MDLSLCLTQYINYSHLCSSPDSQAATQYGFRPHRGTAQPLFIVRRSMEWSEMTSKPRNHLCLDWKQAFDPLDHSAMIIALRRFGLSRKSLAVMNHNAKGSVGSGIRQGRPLSHYYLFIMVLTVTMEDGDWDLAAQGVARNAWSVAIDPPRTQNMPMIPCS